jgi:hypothetical protein
LTWIKFRQLKKRQQAGIRGHCVALIGDGIDDRNDIGNLAQQVMGLAAMMPLVVEDMGEDMVQGAPAPYRQGWRK